MNKNTDKALVRFATYFVALFTGQLLLGGDVKKSFTGSMLAAGVAVPALWYLDKSKPE